MQIFEQRDVDRLPLHVSDSLVKLFGRYSGPPFAIRFWDDSVWAISSHAPVFTIVFHSERIWKRLLSGMNELSVGEAFVAGDLDVEGDLYAAFQLAQLFIARTIEGSEISPSARILLSANRMLAEARRFIRLEKHHSVRRDANSISYHYDKPAEFYRLWLGESMVYSCAYFHDPTQTLDQGQYNKLEHICRKLRLQPQDHFLDIGCGWGSLVLYAARRFSVHASGITLSHEQERIGKQCIQEAGMENKCQIEYRDYRSLEDAREGFDKIASVGMSEHVGLRNLPLYFRKAYSMLRPKGAFLNHAITRSVTLREEGPSFIDQYVFPNGELITLSDIVRCAEAAGFEVRDVEDLREHYERTLHCWVEALTDCKEEALRYVDEKTYRIWKIYMAGCAEAFRRGDIAVYQVLLSKADSGQSGLPLTRADWYLNV
ncbi:MAG: class I SAM-dependent methyltransferase [Silvibacterium sp.]